MQEGTAGHAKKAASKCANTWYHLYPSTTHAHTHTHAHTKKKEKKKKNKKTQNNLNLIR